MTHTPAFVSSTVLKLCAGSPSVAGFSTDAAGVLWGPALWTDDTTPRTDRPAVFYLMRRGAPDPHIVRPPVGFRRIGGYATTR